jgi:hypothetical protein
MTPHPLATYVQMTVSPQRHAIRQRRRRRAVRLLLQTSVRRTAEDGSGAAAPTIPEQRRTGVALPG